PVIGMPKSRRSGARERVLKLTLGFQSDAPVVATVRLDVDRLRDAVHAYRISTDFLADHADEPIDVNRVEKELNAILDVQYSSPRGIDSAATNSFSNCPACRRQCFGLAPLDRKSTRLNSSH